MIFKQLKSLLLSVIMLFFLLPILVPLQVSADSSISKSPTNYESDSTMHHPDAAYAADGISVTADREGEFAVYKTFGISLPPNATINGIEIAILAHADSCVGSPRNLSVLLSWDGGNTYSSPIDPGVFNTTASYKSAGGPTNLWGRTWNENDFNDANFRVKLQAGAGVDSIYVDTFQAKVYYSPDTVQPSATINQASTQLDPTGASPINFTVVFSKPVFGFTSGIILSGTAGATTAVITGSGTTYNVAVSGMVSSGTVIAGVAANSARDAAGNYNTDSTSTDNQVTYNSTLPSYTITVNCGSNGTVSPGTGRVDYGASPVYTISANTGYHISDVKVDNISVGVVSSYQFHNVTADHSLSATFDINKYTVTALVPGGHGAVSPAVQQVNHGSSATITVTPDAGYYIAQISDNGTAAPVANPFVINNVTCSRTVTFTLGNVLTVNASVSGGHGTVSPIAATVTYGSSEVINIYPDAAYHISTITDNGATIPIVNPYVINNITIDHNVIVTFAINTYAITVLTGVNGAITPGTGPIEQGSSPTFVIAGNSGYVVSDVLVDNVSVGAVNSYQFKNVTTEHKISATFVLAPPSPSASSSNNGAIASWGNLAACPVSAQVDVNGAISVVAMNSNGTTCQQCLARSTDKAYQVLIKEGTKLSSVENVIPKYISLKPSRSSISGPEDGILVSNIYDFQGFRDASTKEPLHVEFQPNIQLAMAYDVNKLPENAEVNIAYYDETQGWSAVTNTGGPAEVGIARCEVGHLTPFAVIARSSSKPNIQLTELSINPDTAMLNQEIKVSAVAVNNGSTAGEFTVNLTIDGKARDSRTIKLGRSEKTVVTFTVLADSTGTHKASVNQLDGQFVVADKETSRPYWFIWIIIAVVVFVLIVWILNKVYRILSK